MRDLGKLLDNSSIFEKVFNVTTQLIAIISVDGTLLFVNQAMLAFNGQEEGELVGKPYWELSIWKRSKERQTKMESIIQEALEKGKVRFATTHYNADGESNEIDFVIKTIRNELGDVTHFLVMGYIITELVQTQRALTKRERQIKAFFQYSIDGYFFYMLPDGERVRRVLSDEEVLQIIGFQKFREYNPALCALMEIRDSEIENARFDQIFNVSPTEMIESWRNLITEGVVQLEVKHPDPLDGKELTLEVTLVAIWGEDWEFNGNFGIVRDVTNQREYERRLEFLANKDSLTGIDNRRTFFRRAAEMLEETLVNKRPVHVMMFDLDYFKSVNDTYGHDVGDEVLKRICSICQKSLPEEALFARYGGEEFTIVIVGHRQNKAEEVAERVRALIEDESFRSNGNQFNVTISMGLTHIQEDETRIDDALTRADEALYEAKRKGRNRIVVRN